MACRQGLVPGAWGALFAYSTVPVFLKEFADCQEKDNEDDAGEADNQEDEGYQV